LTLISLISPDTILPITSFTFSHLKCIDFYWRSLAWVSLWAFILILFSSHYSIFTAYLIIYLRTPPLRQPGRPRRYYRTAFAQTEYQQVTFSRSLRHDEFNTRRLLALLISICFRRIWMIFAADKHDDLLFTTSSPDFISFISFHSCQFHIILTLCLIISRFISRL
jgi:hypothetical protein